MQQGSIWNGSTMVDLEFPSESEEVIPGVKWGSVAAFPSPAYWKYQVHARRIQGTKINYRLGDSLVEEVGACLLGGHGIPAYIGLAAYEHLKSRDAFVSSAPTETKLFEWLSEPIKAGDKTVRYRFAKQKARYLAAALNKLECEIAPSETGKGLRNWLLDVPGIGYKTASWVARNWLEADDVAILDIHVLRAGMLGGFFKKGLTVERHYLQIEEQFIAFSHGLDVKASELDAVIWHEMMSSPYAVHHVLGDKASPQIEARLQRSSRPKQRHANAGQLALVI